MLIKALCDYYDILKKEGKVLPDGYSNVNVHYLISLTPDGKIDEIINWQETEQVEIGKGKTKEKQVPRSIILPKRTQKTGIDSNVVEHRPLYIFGLNYDSEAFTPNDKTDKAKKSHMTFKEKNLEFIDGIDSPVVNAYRNFILNWSPENETENQYLLSLGKAYSNSNFSFCLSGRADMLLHEDCLLKEKWEKLTADDGLGVSENEETAQCAVGGEVEAIARIHNKISGLPGGLAVGNTLVCFKNASENSYGKEQSFNSNVSETAMKKYTEVLNMLIKDKKHYTVLDGITVVHWAMSADEKYDDIYDAFTSNYQMDSETTSGMLKSLMEGAKNGNVTTDLTALSNDIDTNVDFYIVGMKPNASRIAIKFIYRKRFGEVLQNIARHQLDMQITKDMKPVDLWQIKKELISPKSKNESVDPALLTKIYEAIIYGTRYPEYLLSTIVKRVKTDSDTETNKFIKLNNIRAGVIKACVNRKSRLKGEKEELKMALDLENNNPAYLCGRLFAVLEKLQQEASNNSLNRTIKDAYFSSASTTPAIIFPKLIKLAQNHLNKVKSKAYYYNRLIEEIINELCGEFPGTLILTDQGKFIIGYYQQYQDFFVKKEDRINNNTQEEN